MRMRFSLGSALALAQLLSLAASAALIPVRPGQSIQSAVDRARPGDVVWVLPGLYTGDPALGSVVHVRTSGLTLVGSPRSVIDATGLPVGIRVGERVRVDPGGCPPVTVQGFRLLGFTIRNADFSGSFLLGVENYELANGRYVDNAEYGPFPICSLRGRIAGNYATGHDDAAIYVGDDDGVIVEHNWVDDSTIGVEVENSENAIVRHNVLVGNTAGALVVVLPGLPKPFTRNVRIHSNIIANNNRPNPIPPDDPDALAQLPTGTGILNVGGDQVVIGRNLITGNDSFGVGIVGNPFFAFDPRIEPFVDDNRVRYNLIAHNGAAPDPLRAQTPGADIVFVPDVVVGGSVVLPDPDPTDNCFARNRFGTDFPNGITALFACPEPTPGP
jgi:parallel beta-helix repeat protein